MSVFRSWSHMVGLFGLFQSQRHIKNLLFSSGITSYAREIISLTFVLLTRHQAGRAHTYTPSFPLTDKTEPLFEWLMVITCA